MAGVVRWFGRAYCALLRGRSDVSGNVAIVFALGLVPAVGLTGVAVDYSKSSQLRTRMQQVLDASVLAGVKEPDTSLQVSKATSVFNAQAVNDWGAPPTAS